MGFNDDTQSTNGGFNLQEVYEHKREEHLRNMQDKEDEMRQVNSQIKSNASQKYIKFRSAYQSGVTGIFIFLRRVSF